MKLLDLKIHNFRNYENITFLPFDGLNVLYGKNGSGKTNIVEAIYVLLLTKSFRTLNDQNLIKYNQDMLKVEGKFQSKNEKCNFKLIIDKNGKTVFINNDKIRLLSDYISKVNIVLFSPNDLKIIKDSPGFRRKYLNIMISQFDKRYLFYLNDYNKVLKQRNSYIKQLSLNSNISYEYLDILTKKLIEKGIEIWNFRNNYLNNINEKISSFYNKISLSGELTIKYKSQYKVNDVNKLIEMYKKNYIRELNLGKTLIGVHLDDFELYLDDKNVREFGSEGQQKNSVISFKLSELEILKNIKGEYPILILDDIFSELDIEKINNILDLLPLDIQTFITTTETSKIEKKYLEEANIIKVKDGMLGVEENE